MKTERRSRWTENVKWSVSPWNKSRWRAKVYCKVS